MSERCGVCKELVEFTMPITVEHNHNGKVSKRICMKCMHDLPEQLKKVKEKVNDKSRP